MIKKHMWFIMIYSRPIAKKILTFFIDSGFDINEINNHGSTALILACMDGLTEIAKILLKAPNIDVNKQNYNGDTPLTWACYNGNLELVKLLISKPNIDFSKKDMGGKDAIYWAKVSTLPDAKAIIDLLKKKALENRMKDLSGV
jgi:ankyrin repeat protein